MTRAWRAYDRFEGRSEVRTWLYRIASNVCFDALRGRQRRALPMEMTGVDPGRRRADRRRRSPESAFVEPVPGNIVSTHPSDPAEAVAERESIRLAFVAALQHLPPQQRAVLILRDVLKWQASEVAELLGTTVAGVNSALQRAHATMNARSSRPRRPTPSSSDEAQRQLLAQLRRRLRALRHRGVDDAHRRGRDAVDAAVGDVAARAATRSSTGGRAPVRRAATRG